MQPYSVDESLSKKQWPSGWKGDIPTSEGGEPDYVWPCKPPFYWESKQFEQSYMSTCMCERVCFEFMGDPVEAKHCHCTQCQMVHGAPFQWAALYPKPMVRLVRGFEYLKYYSTQDKSSAHKVPSKIRCGNCGSPMVDEGRRMVIAYPTSFNFKDGVVPTAFKPSCHIFYKERVMDLYDDTPKYEGDKANSETMDSETDMSHRTLPRKRHHDY